MEINRHVGWWLSALSFLSGWGSACVILSLCLISPGQFLAVINTAPSTWKLKPLPKWNTIRGGGEKSNLSSVWFMLIIHHSNLRSAERQSDKNASCCCEDGGTDKQGDTSMLCSCVTHETFHLRGFFLSWGLTFASQDTAAWFHCWHWPPLCFF